jgi:hypothetical protein
MATPLLSDDFKDGQGIVFIGLEGEGDKAKFSLSNEAREFLETVGFGLLLLLFRVSFHLYTSALPVSSCPCYEFNRIGTCFQESHMHSLARRFRCGQTHAFSHGRHVKPCGEALVHES